jgi:hypothetical protein
MVPAPTIPPFNMAFSPRPSVMNSSYTNTKSSTITPRHIPNNIVSHTVFLQDTEPLDPSYKRILESPTYHPIHLRSIAETPILENDTANTTPVHGEAELQTEMSPAIIIGITVILLVLLVICIFGCDKYLSYREKVEMNKQQEEERWNNSNDAERKERIQEGELVDIDLGDLGVAVVEHVEYADVESVKEVAKEKRGSGSGWMRFWR